MLAAANLVNYFGKTPTVDDITVSPILIQKGRTRFALYGLGGIRDERLYRTFVNHKVLCASRVLWADKGCRRAYKGLWASRLLWVL